MAIIDLPYYVVDALLGRLLVEFQLSDKITWKWRMLTSGSSRHTVEGFFVFAVYARSNERTEIIMEYPQVDFDTVEKFFATTIKRWSDSSDPIPADLNKALSAVVNIPEQKKHGRGVEEDPDNQWARDAYLANPRNRKAIEQEWIQRKKYDISDPQIHQTAKSAFRVMLSRNVKKRNAT